MNKLTLRAKQKEKAICLLKLRKERIFVLTD